MSHKAKIEEYITNNGCMEQNFASVRYEWTDDRTVKCFCSGGRASIEEPVANATNIARSIGKFNGVIVALTSLSMLPKYTIKFVDLTAEQIDNELMFVYEFHIVDKTNIAK